MAGRDLILSALADNSTSKNSRWSASISLGLSGVTIGGSISDAHSKSTVYTNAQLTAGNTISIITGRDAFFLGANVQAGLDAGHEDYDATVGSLYLDIGRDLTIASRQNTSSSYQWGFNASVTIGPTPGGIGINAFSAGGNYGRSNRRYTDTASTLIANNVVDIYVGRTTKLLGAIVNSRSGNLTLDTGHLVYDNLSDRDRSYSFNASVSWSASATHKWDGTVGFGYHNVEALSFATIGAGDINIRHNANHSLEGLNRDANNTHVITSQTNIDLQLPGLNLNKLADNIRDAGNFIEAAIAEIPQSVRANGDAAVRVYQRLILNGASNEQVRALIGTDLFNAVIQKARILDDMKLAGHTPDKFDLALLAQGETLLFGAASNYEGGSILVPCDTNGTRCEIALDEFKNQLQQNPNYVESVLATLLKRVPTYWDGSRDDIEGIRNFHSANNVFAELMRCAIIEPAVFAKFVGATPWAERPAEADRFIQLMATAYGTSAENLRRFSEDWLRRFGDDDHPADPSVSGILADYGLINIIPSIGAGDPRNNGHANETWSPFDFVGPGLISGAARLSLTGSARAAEQVLANGGRTELIALLRAKTSQLAGFTSREGALILDENLMARGVVEQLRANGYNVRSITEVFGKAGVSDPEILNVARAIGARVITNDRGRQISGGFGQLAIQINSRATSASSILRVLEQQGVLRR